MPRVPVVPSRGRDIAPLMRDASERTTSTKHGFPSSCDDRPRRRTRRWDRTDQQEDRADTKERYASGQEEGTAE